MNEISRTERRADLALHTRQASLLPHLVAYADAAMQDKPVALLTQADRRTLAETGAALSQLLQPATQEQIWVWLQGLADLSELPRAPNSPEKWKSYARGVFLACADIPAGAWTAKAQGELLRRVTFWPVPKEIYDALEPGAAELRRTHYRVKAINRADSAQQESARLEAAKVDAQADPAQLERISAEVREATRALAVPRGPYQRPSWPDRDYRPPSRPAYATPGQMIEMLRRGVEQAASPELRQVAAARLARLTQEFGQDGGSSAPKAAEAVA